VTTFLKLAIRGAGSMATAAAAVLLWLLRAHLACTRFAKQNYRSVLAHPAMLMLLTALLMFAAGLYSHKDSPNAIAAVGDGNRYTWVPYVLIATAAFLLSNGRKAIGNTCGAP